MELPSFDYDGISDYRFAAAWPPQLVTSWQKTPQAPLMEQELDLGPGHLVRVQVLEPGWRSRQ
jgi:hypothetical protein